MTREILIIFIIFLFLMSNVLASKNNTINFNDFKSNQSSDFDGGLQEDKVVNRILENKTFAKQLMFHNETDYKTLDIIDDKVWLRVLVDLKDKSGINVTGTKEEKRELVNRKVEWFEKESKKVLEDYLGEDFVLRGMTSGGFGLLVAEKGLKKLMQDERIEEIIWIDSKPELSLYDSAILLNADNTWSAGYAGEGVLKLSKFLREIFGR